MAEIEATREYAFEKDPAYQIGEDEKGYQIRLDANGRWIAIKDTEVVHAAFTITDQEIFCAIPESNGTTVIVRKNPEAKPLEEVLGTQIQIYNRPELDTRITESLFYTNSKGKQKLLPFAAVLREQIRDKINNKNNKNPSMDQILQAVHELRDGSLEEQAIYGLFREHLIENGFMPLDENGKPYDLSVMHIPAFTPDKILDCPDTKLKDFVLTYYQLNRKDQKNIKQKDFMHCMNKMKSDAPERFVKLHNYLAGAGLIPEKSPMLAEQSLTPEHIDYLRHLETPAVEDAFNYFNSIISETIKTKTGKTVVFWNIRDQSREWIESYAPKINRVLANMRFGSVEDQKRYYDFCIAISGLNNTIFAEKPSYQEKAKTMFAQAEAQRARATIESRL